MDSVYYISDVGVFKYEFSPGELLAATLSGHRNAHIHFVKWLASIYNVKSSVHVEMRFMINGSCSTTNLVVSAWVDPQLNSYHVKICDGENTIIIDTIDIT